MLHGLMYVTQMASPLEYCLTGLQEETRIHCYTEPTRGYHWSLVADGNGEKQSLSHSHRHQQ